MKKIITVIILQLFAVSFIQSQNVIKVKPKSIFGSSAYKKYGPVENIFDGRLDTYWNPRKKKGIGEFFEIEFDNSIDIKYLKIFAGVGKSRAYYINNRFSDITIIINDKEKLNIKLKDIPDFKTVQLNRVISKLKIIINNRIIGRHPNSKKRSNYISEVEVYAINPKSKTKFENNYKKLKNNSFSYLEVKKIQNNFKYQYKYLLPKDKEKYNSLINIKLIESAKKDMISIQNQIIDIPNDSKKSFYKINSLREEVYGRLGRQSKFLKLDIVQNTLKKIKQKKTKLVDFNYNKIIDTINKVKSNRKLNFLINNYIKNTDNTSNVLKIKETIKINEKRLLKEYNQRIKIAKIKEQERIRKEKEENRIAEAKRLKQLKKQMNETTKTGEPTELQMKFAVNYQIEAKNKKMNNLSNVNATDAGSALLKLAGMGMKGTEASISSFEKYSCVRAQGKPGFNCDYAIKIKIKGGITGSMFGGLLNQANNGSSEIRTARFSKIKGYWMIVEYLDK